MLHAVIMAGGSGTRFWPLSRVDLPKQLLDILGDRTLIQATVDRLGDLVPPGRVVVATTARLAGPIAEQLPQVHPDAILVEPCKRDTAPCIGLAALRVVRDDPDATMAVMPSDQVIGPDGAFQQAIRFGEALVDEDPRRLVTFGIRPSYPAESFGYIEHGEVLPPRADSGPHAPAAYRVRRFHEKPKGEVARQYLEAGSFFWNAGIFLWRAQTILDELARRQPEMYAHLRRIADAFGSAGYEEVLQREFTAIAGTSIDFAVMEGAEELVVVEAPFDWDDVGSWRSLERHRPADAQGNVVDAARHLGIETTGTIVRCGDPGHVVVTVGVDDLIVIVTPDATLVASKHHEEAIRQVTRRLEELGWQEHL